MAETASLLTRDVLSTDSKSWTWGSAAIVAGLVFVGLIILSSACGKNMLTEPFRSWGWRQPWRSNWSYPSRYYDYAYLPYNYSTPWWFY